MQQNNTHAFTDKLQKINQVLGEPHNRELLDAEMTLTLQRDTNNIRNNIEQNFKEGRKLSIGIMGAMKAGKSSFLNALLFDGEDVLPKAATPMTASLTVLSYAPKSHAKITFFKKEDWQLIETACERLEQEVQRIAAEEQQRNNPDKNNQFSALGNSFAPKKPRRVRTPDEIRKDLLMQNDEIRSYYEVHEQVRKNNLNLNEYLGQEKEITSDQEDWRKFLSSLNEYVGAEGRFTPLVNYITLELNNEMLQDLEIIDTPGLNDPFTSRSNRTKSYLGKCDVVLYVCQVSQFITKQDVDFICQDMRENATADAYIIGSQIDSGILQYSSKEHSFIRAYQASIAVYNRQAQDTLSKQQHNPIVKKILDKLPPKYISSLMFSIAQKKQRNQPLNEAENHILTQMQRQFTDISKAFESVNDYFDLAGIGEVKTDILDQIRERKQELIADKNSKYITSVTQGLLETLSKLSQELSFKLRDLKDESHDPRKKLKELQNNLNAARYDIAHTLNEHANRLNKLTQRIKLEVEKAMKDHHDFEVSEETSSSSSTSGFWLWKKTTTTTTTHHYANATEAVRNIRQYAAEAQGIINSHLDAFNSREELMDQLSKNVMSVFNLSDSDFNPHEILGPIEACLSNFEVLPVNMDQAKAAESALEREYPSARVVDDDIHQLQRSQQQYLNQVQEALWSELDNRMQNIQQFLNKQSVELCDHVAAKISHNCEQIEKMSKDRDTYIRNIEQLMAQLTQFQRDLTN